jgi:putative endopeptidase
MEELVGNLRSARAEHRAEHVDDRRHQARGARQARGVRAAGSAIRTSPKTYDGWRSAPTPARQPHRREAWQRGLRPQPLGQKVDRSEWGYYAQTVNAGYSPTSTRSPFPAAILQQPFFGPSADPAVNYGAIGAVIGHEMGHGFDDQGAKSDGTACCATGGRRGQAQFEALGNRLAAQYARIARGTRQTCVNGG